jgi:hypothetical protein
MKISRDVQKECPIFRHLAFFLLAAHQVKPERFKYRVFIDKSRCGAQRIENVETRVERLESDHKIVMQGVKSKTEMGA